MRCDIHENKENSFFLLKQGACLSSTAVEIFFTIFQNTIKQQRAKLSKYLEAGDLIQASAAHLLGTGCVLSWYLQ